MISLQFHRFILACAIATSLSANLTQAAPAGGPLSVSVAASAVDATIGKSITLSVNADGAPPLRYCWRKDGQILPGQTGAQLKIDTVVPSTAGAYTVEVANAHETVSEVINVRVVGPALRIYRHKHGIKVSFKARRCVRYEIESTDALAPAATVWTHFALIDRNGRIRLTDPSVPTHFLCVFRLKAEMDCQCGRHHDRDEEDQDLEVERTFGES